MAKKGEHKYLCANCKRILLSREVDTVLYDGSTYCEACIIRQNGSDQRARARGAQAGLDGLGPFDNPYKPVIESELRRHWEEMRLKVKTDVRGYGLGDK